MVAGSPAWKPQATFALVTTSSRASSFPSVQTPKPSPRSALRSMRRGGGVLTAAVSHRARAPCAARRYDDMSISRLTVAERAPCVWEADKRRVRPGERETGVLTSAVVTPALL